MAIRLTRIYTRSGDKGLTALVGGARVPKESGRLEAYGTIDELNSIVGIVRSYLPDYKRRFGEDYALVLRDAAAHPERTVRRRQRTGDAAARRVRRDASRWARRRSKQLEQEMDRMQKELKPLNSFTLPGGGVLNAFLHQARTVCRRAERVCWALRRVEPINDHLMAYVNRLSDHLFVQSRWVAKRLEEPEFLWDRGLRIDPRAAVAAKRRTAAAADAASGKGKDAPRRGKR